MKAQINCRGFTRVDFTDRYGHACSLQESSLATEGAIWFGPNEPDTQFMSRASGWQPYKYPTDVEIVHHTRAHITQEQVQELLPALQYFAKHGTLPEVEGGLLMTQQNLWKLAANELFKPINLLLVGIVSGMLGGAFGSLQNIGAF